MSITSMLFLFLFLPLSLGIYYMVNDGIKEYILLAISLLFYSLGSPRYLTLFIVVTFITVVIGRELAKTKTKLNRQILMAFGIAINVGILGYYKYSDFAISIVNSIGQSEIKMKNLLLPLGISFFTFKAISYLVDVYLQKVVLAESPVHDALYLSFFTQIQSGPLTRYNDMKNVGISINFNERFNLFSDGVFRFLIGFNKKILLADVLVHITDEVFSNSFDNFSISYAWLGSICYSLQLFFDFAGYSDMAIGISEMFGYRCIENFNYPYMTESVSKFWRRWHISLSQWFRDYVYIPLGGGYGPKWKVYFNLLIVWGLTGIWHGAAWNFVIWGLGYFILITFEKATGFPERFGTQIGKFIYRIFTLLFINFQWIIFRADNLMSALRYIKRMFLCKSNAMADLRTLFLLKDYLGFILIAIVLCFPVVPWIGSKLENRKMAHHIYEIAVSFIIVNLFIWAISFVVSGQNSPFAYANF